MFAQVFKAATINRDDGPQTVTPLKTRCNTCLWRGEDGITCDAFPAGIPVEVLTGAYDHVNPYDVDGVDDGGLRFTPDPFI